MKFIAHYDEQAAAMCLAACCFQQRSADEAAVLQLSQRKHYLFFFPPHKIIQAVFLLNKSSVACNKSSDNAVELRSQCGAQLTHGTQPTTPAALCVGCHTSLGLYPSLPILSSAAAVCEQYWEKVGFEKGGIGGRSHSRRGVLCFCFPA